MTLSASSRTLLILSSLALLLLALLLLTGGEEGSVDDQPLRLFADGEIDKVEIDLDDGRRFRLEQRGDDWYLSEPIESLADKETVKALTTLIGQMVAIPLEHDSSQGAETLAAYGIGTEGQFRLALQRAGGGFEEIILGRGIPLDVGYVYAWDPGDERLYKVQREIREFLDRTLFEMRNKRLSFLAPQDVTAVTIESAGATLQLDQKEEWWEITEPLKAPADSRAVEALLEGLTALGARDFPELQRAEGPVRRLTLRTRSGETETIGIGASYDGGLTLVEADKPGGPFGVESAALEALPFRLEDFISQGIMRYRPEEIEAVYIATPEDQFSLQLRGGNWLLDNGNELPADSGLIGRLLKGLLQVEGKALLQADSEEIRQRSEYRIVLKERNGSEQTLWLASGRGSDGSLRGVSSFRDEPFSVQGMLSGDIPLTPAQFEDRHLLYFDTREIGAVEYSTVSEGIRIEKRGSDWFLTRPARSAADKQAVWQLLFAAEKLTFISRVPASEAQDARAEAQSVSLNKSIELKLFSADGKQEAALRLYNDSASGEVYAESSDRAGLFLINPSFVAELPAGSEELTFTR